MDKRDRLQPGNLGRRLVVPKRLDNWWLTSLQQRLVKTGGRLINHARYYWLLLAERSPRRHAAALERRCGESRRYPRQRDRRAVDPEQASVRRQGKEKCRRKRSEKQEPWALSFLEAVKTGFPPATGSTGHRKLGCSIPQCEIRRARPVVALSRSQSHRPCDGDDDRRTRATSEPFLLSSSFFCRCALVPVNIQG